METDPTNTGPSEDARCETCDGPIHRDGFVWAHEDPSRVYGHVARKETTNAHP